MRELVDHHTLEDVCLRASAPCRPTSRRAERGKAYLIINIMKDIFPEWVEDSRGDEEPADAHPEAVCEGDEGKRDDEVGEDGGDEDDEGFGGEEIEEEPHDPSEEGDCV